MAGKRVVWCVVDMAGFALQVFNKKYKATHSAMHQYLTGHVRVVKFVSETKPKAKRRK